MDVSIRELTIVHVHTKEEKTLRVVNMSKTAIELHWPLGLNISFDPHTGKGNAKASRWILRPDMLTLVHADLGIHEVKMETHS